MHTWVLRARNGPSHIYIVALFSYKLKRMSFNVRVSSMLSNHNLCPCYISRRDLRPKTTCTPNQVSFESLCTSAPQSIYKVA